MDNAPNILMLVAYCLMLVAGWLMFGLAALLLGASKMNLPTKRDAWIIVGLGPAGFLAVIFTLVSSFGTPWIPPKDWHWPKEEKI